jgi:hypothetical protein
MFSSTKRTLTKKTIVLFTWQKQNITNLSSNHNQLRVSIFVLITNPSKSMKGVRVSSHDGERRWRNRWKGLRLGVVVSIGWRNRWKKTKKLIWKKLSSHEGERSLVGILSPLLLKKWILSAFVCEREVCMFLFEFCLKEKQSVVFIF